MRHIHPLEPIGVVVLILILWYMRRKPKQQGAGGGAKRVEPRAGVQRAAKVEQPAEVVYMDLRQKALATVRDSLGLPGLPGDIKPDEPYGLVMEMGISDSVVTLACFANGDASLYYQSGGGMTGGISHESVRKAARELIALAQKALPGMTRTSSHPLPGPGKVRFYALTPRGILTTETDREALAQPRNPLAPLFYSGQEVVSQMRQVQEQRRAEGAG
jgi:hypothetical protein